MATTTNFGWETPDDTDLVKDGAAAMRTLGNSIDTSLVDLKGGTTGQVLSKASNTDMDFTWVAQDDSNAIQNAIVDAKGDLISATAADTPARLASSGVNGDVLTVDTSASTGLKWAAPTTPGLVFLNATSFTNVASQSINSVFSSTYASYLITYNIQGQDTTARAIYVRLRASSTDTTTNYVSGFGGWNIEGTGQTLNEAVTGSTFIQLGYSSNNTDIQRLVGQAYLHNPNVAQYTTLLGNATAEKAGAYKGGYQTYGMQTGTTQFDGLTIYAASGNITGTVRIYGLRNS